MQSKEPAIILVLMTMDFCCKMFFLRRQPDKPLAQPTVASPQAPSLHALKRPPSSIIVAMGEVSRLNSSRDRTRGVETAPGEGSGGVGDNAHRSVREKPREGDPTLECRRPPC
jgi:hypothetical protein